MEQILGKTQEIATTVIQFAAEIATIIMCVAFMIDRRKKKS